MVLDNDSPCYLASGPHLILLELRIEDAFITIHQATLTGLNLGGRIIESPFVILNTVLLLNGNIS
jgi:hypothetical protein